MARHPALLGALGLVLAATAGCRAGGPGFSGPDVLYVATPDLVGLEMLRLAGVTTGDVVYDLGSGDGRLIIAAARDFGARGVGVEIEPALVQTSRESALTAGVGDRVQFLWQDLFAADIRGATVVALYLRDDVNLRLRPRLLRELRPGTRIVSHDFGMADWRPDRLQRVRGPDREHTIYYWLVPADVAGTWRAALRPGEGEQAAVIELRQRFQQVSGTLDLEGRRITVEGRLAGEQLSFTAEGVVFTARIEGDLAAGRFGEPGGRSSEWSARRRTGR
jgi:SAM-dependent methyltransferase